MLTSTAIKLPIDVSWMDYPVVSIHCLSIYFMGCEHACPGCHNPELQQEASKGMPMEEILHRIDEASRRHRTNNLALMGGDPLHPNNAMITNYLLSATKYTITIYTGYAVEYAKNVLSKDGHFQFLKCGKFDMTKQMHSEKTDEHFRLASSNQIIYDSKFNPISVDGVLQF